MEKAREFQKNISICFIDYAKAFNCLDHSKLWQVLKEMGVPGHLIYLLRNLYMGEEATVITENGTTDWYKIGKGNSTSKNLKSWPLVPSPPGKQKGKIWRQ